MPGPGRPDRVHTRDETAGACRAETGCTRGRASAGRCSGWTGLARDQAPPGPAQTVRTRDETEPPPDQAQPRPGSAGPDRPETGHTRGRASEGRGSGWTESRRNRVPRRTGPPRDRARTGPRLRWTGSMAGPGRPDRVRARDETAGAGHFETGCPEPDPETTGPRLDRADPTSGAPDTRPGPRGTGPAGPARAGTALTGPARQDRPEQGRACAEPAPPDRQPRRDPSLT